MHPVWMTDLSKCLLLQYQEWMQIWILWAIEMTINTKAIHQKIYEYVNLIPS